MIEKLKMKSKQDFTNKTFQTMDNDSSHGI